MRRQRSRSLRVLSVLLTFAAIAALVVVTADGAARSRSPADISAYPITCDNPLPETPCIEYCNVDHEGRIRSPCGVGNVRVPDCLTGADASDAAVPALPLTPPGQTPRRPSTGVIEQPRGPFLGGPFAIVARVNQRFALQTRDGAILFRPSGRNPAGVATLPTSTGVSLFFTSGVTQPGRYRWRISLEKGQRFKRRHAALLLTDTDGKAILRITVRRLSPTGAAGPRRASAAQKEDPPSAGSESDGVYVDYQEGTDNDVVNVVPVGDPDPFDCKAAQTPGTTDAPPPSSGDASVDMTFQETLPATARNGKAPANAALVAGKCTGTVRKPFKAGAVPGFLGYEYARSTLGCDPNVGALFKVNRIKVSKKVGTKYKGRRTRTKISAGAVTSLSQTRTVCRSANLHRWRASARFTVVASKRPYIQSASRRAYSSDYCG